MNSENDVPKYASPAAIDLPDRRWPSRTITKSPIWCSVDLRDGNQALPNPMEPDQKLEYFQLLTRIGFKHIEVAFPSASKADFGFTRRLIEEGHIPDDVFIMGLTQCREALIERTLEALKGVPRAITHIYLATSELHMRQVFSMDRRATMATAVKAATQAREIAATMPETDMRLEFSPEEFTDTDPVFANEICRAVFEAWGRATPEKPLIMNLPATVERRPPNHYADMVERFCRDFPERESILVSLHSHNDQGMAVAATEMALLAGADRVEGTLFGHGERTGNADLVIMANNLRSRGVETGLDFSDLEAITDTVERLTGMKVYYRQPYSGEYVFTAFSGSHQDAIRKGMRRSGEAAGRFGIGWKVPYLHVDPADLGRRYEGLIRINSQSGKGGVAWVLEQDYGFEPPKAMHPEIGAAVQRFSDTVGREVTSPEVRDVFMSEFVEVDGPYRLVKFWPRPDDDDPTHIHGELRIVAHGEERTVAAEGNGPVSAFVHCMRELGVRGFTIDDYDEQALGKGADAVAVAYVPLRLEDGTTLFGVGMDTNIDQAAVRAILAAVNRMER